MPMIAQTPEGKVTSVWGTALIRGTDGKLRLLKVGDMVRKGDQILTAQDGIVQIANGDDGVPAASAAKRPAPAAADDVERAITELNRGDRDAAPAAGLAGGGDGSLQEGLRVERIGESVGSAEVPRSTADAELRVAADATGASSRAANQTGSGLPPLDAPSSAISAAEEGAPANLGLSAPTGPAAGGTIRVDQVPTVGEIRKADGTLVTAGTVLTPADLPGLSYVPPAEYDGAVPAGNFTYTITTGDGRSTTGGTTVTLDPVNDAPIATPGSTSGNEDGSLPVSLGGTDIDGRIVGVTVTALPAGGTLWLADGTTPVAAGQTLTPEQAASLIYRPGADFHGDQSIFFNVTDNGGLTSAPAAITLTVVSVNDLPQPAAGSGGSGNEDTPIAVRLGGSDTDGSVVAVTVTTLPANGTLFLADGVTPVAAGTALTPAQAANLVFVPSPDFSGSVTIGFSVTDDQGGTSAPGSAVVTVLPVNDAPVAQPDGATLAEDSVATGNVLGNDSDIDGPALAVSSFTFGGNSFAAGSTAIVGGVGTLSVAADGSWTFTPAPNFNGVVPPIVVTVSDGSLTSSSALTLTVTPVNDAPLLQADLASTPINTPTTITVLANDSDVEGEALTVTAATLADPSQGTVVVNPDGTLGFVPATNFTGTVTITYSASDASGATSTSTVTVNVGNNNPPSGADVVRSLPEDGSYTLQPADFGFSDADAGQALANVRIDSLPGAGTLLLNGTPVAGGTVVSAAQLAAGALQFHPATEGNGSNYANFTFSVQDSAGAFDATPNTFQFDVTAVNDAPLASSSTISVAEESSDTPLGLVAPTDVDGDALTITVTGLPSVGTVTLADGTPVTNGQVLSAAQLAGLQFDAPADLPAAATTSFTYAVSDGTTIVNAGTTINVAPINDAPVANADTVTTAEDTALTIPVANLLGNDVDVDGDPLGVVSVQGAVNGTVALVGSDVVFTPAANYHGPASFSYTVSDGNGGSATTTVTVDVTPVNDAPIAVGDIAATAINVALPAIGVLGNDTDDDGDALTVTSATLENPAQGTVTINANGTLNFVPAANVSGTVTINYAIADGNGGTATASVAVNVGTNTPPQGADATVSVAEDGSRAFAPADFGFSDADAGQTMAAVRIDALPAAGTLLLNGAPVTAGTVVSVAQLNAGALSFAPAADANGAGYASFTFSVQDSAGGFDTTSNTLTIDVTPVNDAPVASSTTLSVAEESVDTPLGLAAPTDADGNALTITVTGLPSVGTVTLADGTPVTNGQLLTATELAGLQFDAPADLLAATSTSFTYSVSDGTATVNAGTTINVVPVNDAPVASSSTISVAEESADTPLGLAAPTDVDGNALTITVTGLPSVGTVTLADGTPVTNGQVLTAAQLAGLQFDAPADLLAATTTSFTYSVNDGTTTVNAGTTINVTPVNDAPVAQPAAFTVAEDAPVVSGAVSATDVDAGATLSFALSGAAPAGLAFNSDGTYSFDPANAAYQSLGVGQQQVITVPYTVGDGTASSTANLVITVTGTNDAPVANVDNVAASEDTAVTLAPATLLSNDTDPDAGTTLTITSVQSPVNGTVALVGGNVVFTPTANYNGPASFTYTVSDGQGGTSTTTVNILVAGVNDTPVAQAASFTVAEDAAIVNGAVSATDADAGATLTFALNGSAPAGLTFNTNGSYSFDPSNAAYQSLAQGQSTVLTIPYTVTDETGANSTANLVITVTGTNDGPVAIVDTGSLAESATLTTTAATGVLANDTDVDGGDTLSVSAVSFGATSGTVGSALNGTYGTLTLNADGSYSYVANRPAAESLVAGQTATETFTYTVRDAAGATSSTTLTFTITGGNDAPTITGPLTGAVQEDTTLSTTGTLVIADADAGQSSFVAQSGTAGTYGTFSITAAGVWTYTLNNAAANVQALPASAAPIETFTVTTADGTTRTISVTVNGLNDAPVAQAGSFTVAEDAAAINGAVTATDVDTGATQTYALNGAAPAGLTFNSNGSYSFDPANAAYQSLGVGQQQVITVPYTVTDNSGATATANLVITVTGTNDTPVANANTVAATEDTALTITPATLLANDTDADAGSTLAITSVQSPVNGTVALVGGNVVFTPTANYSGPASFTYTVADGQGATSTATVTVNVAAVADAPTLSIGIAPDNGSTTSTAGLPASTGLVRAFYDNVATVGADNAGTIATVEANIEATTPTSTTSVTDIAVADIGVDDAYRYTGYIYLQAGQTYQVAGSRDDTLMVKLGGTSVYSVGFNNWGAFSATSFTPTVSGFYSLEVVAYNGDGIGNLDLNMSVNGAAAVDLNTSNFRLYGSASDFTGTPAVAGTLVPNNDGGYYPGSALGNEDTAIRLGSVTAALTDTDGSETLSLTIGSIPAGATLTDGTHTFTATAGNTSAVVTDWTLNNLSITPPANFSGSISLSVTATSTEASGPAASTTGTMNVIVSPVVDAPVLAGDTVLVAVGQQNTATTINFPMLATLADTDGSETLGVVVSGVPTGATFSAGTNTGSGTWSFTQQQLDGLTMTLPSNYDPGSGVSLTVTAVSTESSSGAQRSDSQTITLYAAATNATTTGTSGNESASFSNGTDRYFNMLGGNDTVSAGSGNDLVRGGDGIDTLRGNNGNDALYGDAGDDVILGGAGRDLIVGGAGSDTLTGGTGASGVTDTTTDVFAWGLADRGTVGTPAVDTITDFNAAAVSSGGDVLDLRDLLSGEALGAGNTAGNLANYLDFAVSGSGASATTTIHISSNGQFVGGNYVPSAEDQTIVLQGVDLPSALGLGSGATDAQIVQELINRGKLIVDSVGP